MSLKSVGEWNGAFRNYPNIRGQLDPEPEGIFLRALDREFPQGSKEVWPPVRLQGGALAIALDLLKGAEAYERKYPPHPVVLFLASCQAAVAAAVGREMMDAMGFNEKSENLFGDP